MATNSRVLGIRHRIKKTKEGEARPTMVAIRHADTNTTTLELDNDTAELDFVRGIHPIAWRNVVGDEPLTSFRERHCKWRRVKDDEDVAALVPHHLRERAEGKKTWQEVVTKVPSQFEGLRAGDTVAMVMGGSGDRLAAALSRRGEDNGARVYRLPPIGLKDRRGTDSKDDDHLLLIRLVEEDLGRPQAQRAFYQVRRRDRRVILVQETFRLRMDAMKARIATEQRLYQRAVGWIFLSEDGGYPEGRIEDEVDAQTANNDVLKAMITSEDEQFKELEQAVKQLDVYREVFAGIEGCGPRLAAGIISAIGTFQRFEVPLSVEEEARIQESYGRSQKLEQDAHADDDIDKVSAQVQPNMNRYQILCLVRNWKRQNGKGGEAELIESALRCHEERKKIRDRAFQRGMAKFKAFCGVHVFHGGKYANVPTELQFPRRRTSPPAPLPKAANWSGVARQSLYLLVTDQFNRRPNSMGGKMLRAAKARLREIHPEGVKVERPEGGGTKTVSRYTDGHIHKMGVWRTATRICERIYKLWYRLEKRQRMQTASANAGAAA